MKSNISIIIGAASYNGRRMLIIEKDGEETNLAWICSPTKEHHDVCELFLKKQDLIDLKEFFEEELKRPEEPKK